MDIIQDPEISGEVLIPLENGSFFSNKNIPSFQDLSSCTFQDFRNLLFQGESLRFFIVLKSFKQKIQNISNFFDKMLFKVEFEPNDFDKNLNINGNEEESDDNNNKENFFNFYSSNKNEEEKNTEIKDRGIEFEEIKNKIYDEESSSGIFEIVKEIIVPENVINFNFLMKINLYLENYNVFSENNNEKNILNLYQLGIFDNINNYRHFKIFFKEVKIINALNVVNIKQIEPNIDTSLMQTKLSNYNDIYELYDTSLKNSKIFKNMNKENDKENKSENNRNININDIRILKNETCFDEKATEEIDFIKSVLINEKKLLNQNDFEISIFNKNQFPYIIGSGEEFNLLLKIIKKSYINESIHSTTKINKTTAKERNKSLYLLTQGESNSQNDVSKIIINSITDSFLSSSIFINNSKTLEENDNVNNLNALKKNSVFIRPSPSKSISQKIQEPLMSFGNLIKKKITFKSDNIKENQKNNNINDDTSNSNSNKKIETINTIKTKSNENDIKNNNDDNYLDLDEFFEEQFKIYYITPIILELNSILFYENINMCIHMKWFNEINRYLKISITIPEHIYINEYFEINIKVKNISFNPMNLVVQIKDDENKETQIKNKIKKNIENVPSILSQTKIEHLGLIDCDDEKIFQLKFLPNVNAIYLI